MPDPHAPRVAARRHAPVAALAAASIAVGAASACAASAEGSSSSRRSGASHGGKGGKSGRGSGPTLAAKAGHDAPRWGYAGKGGPKSWGDLSPEFATCRTGADQSPIDLRGAGPGEGDKLRFEYFPTPLSILNNGHTVQVDYERGSYFENGRGRYELAQFHFHGPSEHTLEGESFPLEAHFVHKRVDAGAEGALAVVGVFFKQGERNAVLDAILDGAPVGEGRALIPGLSVNAGAMLPRDGGYFYYPGSLTTPPCSEGVAWHVLKGQLEISREQVARFRKLFKGNARPVQPLRDRVLREM